MTDPHTTPEPAALADDLLPLIPVRNIVLFPGMMVPLTMGRAGSIAAAQAAAQGSRPLGIILQSDIQAEQPTQADLFGYGTIASIVRYATTEDGSHHVVCRGEHRFRLLELVPGYPFLAARVQRLDTPAAAGSAIEARVKEVKARAADILALLPGAPEGLEIALDQISSPAALADALASMLDITPEQKQSVLECLDPAARLDQVQALLDHYLEVQRIRQGIAQQTKARFGEREREVVLREQLRAIQEQLGEGPGTHPDTQRLAQAIAAVGMPDEVAAHARKELRQLERTPEGAGDYGARLGYLEWLTELPWRIGNAGQIDIAQARALLEAEHFGLAKVKRRIIEYLAVRKLNPDGNSPILCLAGPPGVGKTSLGQSIARATGRPFVRVSLGGTHDEAEIRGHRRTYLGALPGNILQAVRKAGARNCVMLLDEVDKLGRGVHGDPAAALLEVLDPEQNASFRDNYLGQPFDLSKVLFICTANNLDNLPGPLRDRMEVIELPGYTEAEKLQIARRYLVARQLATAGLTPDQCGISDAALRALIARYTREAGVRQLEQRIGAVCRAAATRVAEGSARQVAIEEDALPAILGPGLFENEVAMRTGLPGVATGLAWTPVGGDILFIEASRHPGHGKLTLTGQLGEVMKESTQAALSLLKARAASFGITAGEFEHSDIHVHVPAGATPKDGPSAGVAMFVALASLFSGAAVRSDCAMTGEISLRGLVLPVGGIKEKVLAALRAGITTVLLPARNLADLEDVPEDARSQLRFVALHNIDEAVAVALQTSTAAPAPQEESAAAYL